jgi:hypothetical protein
VVRALAGNKLKFNFTYSLTTLHKYTQLPACKQKLQQSFPINHLAQKKLTPTYKPESDRDEDQRNTFSKPGNRL